MGTPEEHHNRCDDITELIDKALDEPVITVEEALAQAVASGSMSPGEAQDCLNAYLNTFLSNQDGTHA